MRRPASEREGATFGGRPRPSRPLILHPRGRGKRKSGRKEPRPVRADKNAHLDLRMSKLELPEIESGNQPKRGRVESWGVLPPR
ncbi:Hypothetical protein NTJ_10933 [Nesidiocoris tenuis]|uniref:Uncharacterized protein n=1 Tax=Nesidiocoris tenuis TaxID=355587 RepID=A0ABN7B1K2_9HEMI|nr:Hypothetical protein NTJ_10933 [Nesidiocoris tenuis]